MSLIPCPTCNATVSEHARACPHCGHPLELASAAPGTPAARGQLAAIMALVIIGSLVVFGGILLLFAWDDVVTILRHVFGR